MTPTVTTLDLIIAVVLLLSGLLAFMRGFVHEVLGIAAWGGATFAAMYGLGYAKPMARQMIASTMIADGVAAVAIFLVVLLILSIITRSLSRAVQTSTLNSLDRSLGFVFGVGRGALLVCMGYIIVTSLMTPAARPGWITGARLLPLIEVGARVVRIVIPEEIMAAQDAAKTAVEKTNQAVEAERAYRRLNDPAPKAATTATDGRNSYTHSERRGIDKLFQSNE